MKRTTIFNFTQNDPSWPKQIDQAFNRCLNFAQELWLNMGQPTLTRKEFKMARTAELIAFNRVVSANEFTAQDVKVLNDFAVVVHDRVLTRFQKAEEAGQLSVEGAEQLKLVKETCIQAAANLCQVMAQFSSWFMHEMVLPKPDNADLQESWPS